MLWYENKNITPVLSSRVRLARNISDIPFPSRLSSQKLKETNELIASAIKELDLDVKLRRVDIETLGDIEVYSMVERHIISPKFAENRDGRILFVSDDEQVSIMIGEEDHLRIQVIKSGLELDEAYALCDKIDTCLGQKLKFAFDENLGFLTECPTNLGTGMRASLMLHLPALNSTGELKRIAESVRKIGLTFRGFYGEGSNAKAGIYQLSNQVTLGISEKDSIMNLLNVAKQIIDKETERSNKLDKMALEDSVYRSFGLLRYARKLSTDEMMQHVSMLMLGERLGLIDLTKDIVPFKIFITTQPAMIRRIYGEKEPHERDRIRAEIIRNTLSSAKF